jgi:hypothetical protein
MPETVCDMDRPEDLGCVLDVVNTNDIVVTNFCAVPGPFQRALDKHKTPITTDACVDQSLNGASSSRPTHLKTWSRTRWPGAGRTRSELRYVFCDDDRRHGYIPITTHLMTPLTNAIIIPFVVAIQIRVVVIVTLCKLFFHLAAISRRS